MDEKPYNILKNAFNKIWNEFGIKIENVNVDWINITTATKRDFIVDSIKINAEF